MSGAARAPTGLRRFLAVGVTAAVLTLVTGCASADESTAGSAPSSPSASASAGGATVAVKEVSGVGMVLVDSAGSALYSPEAEANGKIVCVDACARAWPPLETGGGAAPSPGPGVTGRLGTVDRPGGGTQVTLDGKPLYRFAADPAGAVTGNGVKDSFGGTALVWHVITMGGPAPSSAPASSSPASPEPTDDGGYDKGEY